EFVCLHGPFCAGGEIVQQDLRSRNRSSGRIHDGTGNRGRGSLREHRAPKERKEEEGGDGQFERSRWFRTLKHVSHVDPPFQFRTDAIAFLYRSAAATRDAEFFQSGCAEVSGPPHQRFRTDSW